MELERCIGGGGRTGSTGVGGVRGQPGWPLRVTRGGLKFRWAEEVLGAGAEQKEVSPSGVCRAGGLLPHLPKLLAPLHVSTFHASPPRMPNLAHAICRLSSEIGTRTKAECITSPLLPLHEERRGRDRGPRDKRPTLNFLSCLPAHSSSLHPRSRGFLGATKWGLEVGQGLQS